MADKSTTTKPNGEKSLCVAIDIESGGHQMGKPDDLSIISIGIFAFTFESPGTWRAVHVARFDLSLGTTFYEVVARARDNGGKDLADLRTGFVGVLGYEARCFDEFWAKNLDALYNTQRPDGEGFAERWADFKLERPYQYARVDTLAQMAEGVNELLASYEREYRRVQFLSDTTTYDLSIVSSLLERHALEPLNAKRADGAFQGGGAHITSFVKGVLRLPIDCPYKQWTAVARTALDDKKRELGFPDVAHTHTADEDAASMALDFVAAYSL